MRVWYSLPIQIKVKQKVVCFMYAVPDCVAMVSMTVALGWVVLGHTRICTGRLILCDY